MSVDASAPEPSGYAVLVPVKPPRRGKSRLRGVPDVRRRELAGAFALDTVAAVLATPMVERVLVVTDDALFSRALVALGAQSVPDGDTTDLNATLEQAGAEARRRWPGLRPVALCADLPALRAHELAAALLRAPEGEPGFVTDTAGTGTTLVTAPWEGFSTHFGVGSRAAHLAMGAREIDGPLDSVRRDVDDLDDLRAALALGVGPHTARAVEGWELPGS